MNEYAGVSLGEREGWGYYLHRKGGSLDYDFGLYSQIMLTPLLYLPFCCCSCTLFLLLVIVILLCCCVCPIVIRDNAPVVFTIGQQRDYGT